MPLNEDVVFSCLSQLLTTADKPEEKTNVVKTAKWKERSSFGDIVADQLWNCSVSEPSSYKLV